MPEAESLDWCQTSCSVVIPGEPCDLAHLADSLPVSAQEIAEYNGARWNTPSINEWVISVGGEWAPLAEGIPQSDFPESPDGMGWALLSPDSRIFLPYCEATADVDDGFPWVPVLLGGVAILATVGAVRARRKRRA